MTDSSEPLTLCEWGQKFKSYPAPVPTEAPQARSKQNRPSSRRQPDPDEQLSLVQLALEYAHILRFDHDPRAHEIAVSQAFEEKHGEGFKSVRSMLLDMEKTWRSGPGHGYSYGLSLAITEWSNIVDLERARKAEELAERRIEREILGWDRDPVASGQDRQPEKKATPKLYHVCAAGFLLFMVWSILASKRVDNIT